MADGSPLPFPSPSVILGHDNASSDEPAVPPEPPPPRPKKHAKRPSNSGKELADLMVRLNGQFPNDIGLFVSFFLNYVQLEVGEAMFLKADDIHAYLSGGQSSNHTLPPLSLPN